MERSTAILASLPPIFAIAVEAFNPINESSVGPKIEMDLRKFEEGSNHPHLIERCTKIVCGAVEVAGLAPTFVAALTAGFAVWFEFVASWIKGSFHYADVFVIGGHLLLMLLTLLVLLSFLGGQTYFQIEATRQPWTIIGHTVTLPWSGSHAIARIIILVNLLLVGLIWTAYFMLQRNVAHGGKEHSLTSFVFQV